MVLYLSTERESTEGAVEGGAGQEGGALQAERGGAVDGAHCAGGVHQQYLANGT